MPKDYEELDRRLTIVEQLLNYHHVDIEEIWSLLRGEAVEGGAPEEELSEDAARYSVAGEIEQRNDSRAAAPQAAAATIEAPTPVHHTSPEASTQSAYAPAAPLGASAGEPSTDAPASPTVEAKSPMADSAPDAAPQQTQATQMFQPIPPAPPVAEEPKPASRFAGRKLAEVLPTITSADAHDFAAEAVSRHPAGNAEATDAAIALLEAVTANLVEEAPTEARTMDTLRSMAAQPDDGLKATFDTLAQGLRYDLASQAWVRSERAEEHPSIAPWSKYIAAGELQRMLGREAAENAIKEE